MYRTFILLFFILFPILGSAQLFEEIGQSFKAPSKPMITFGSRNAFVTTRAAKMRHVIVGLNYQDRTKVGLSFNWQAKGFQLPLDNNYLESSMDSTKELRSFYLSGWMEYVFYKNDAFTATIPVQLGAGSVCYRYRTMNDGMERYGQSFAVFYEPTMTASYRFWKYFELGAGIGYRLVVKSKKNIGERLSSPVYLYGLKIYFADIYKEHMK